MRNCPKYPYFFQIGSPAISDTFSFLLSATRVVEKFWLDPAPCLVNVITLA